jgi:hypothetical protein
MLSSELASQRLVADLCNHAFSHPLPKLRLCSPKLFPVATNYERRFLLPLLFLVRLSSSVHPDTPRPLRVNNGKWSHTETPWGSLSCEAATSCQNSTQNSTAVASQSFADSTVVLLSASNEGELAKLGCVVTFRSSF